MDDALEECHETLSQYSTGSYRSTEEGGLIARSPLQGMYYEVPEKDEESINLACSCESFIGPPHEASRSVNRCPPALKHYLVMKYRCPECGIIIGMRRVGKDEDSWEA